MSQKSPDDDPPAGDPPSPCNQICRMDPRTELCVGCGRTIEEIASWQQLPAAARRSIIEQLPRRRPWSPGGGEG